ncbi:MAG TPA: hypothetical protein DCY79_20615 [Planctomycetaceae bacterium]|nr:hypothetical protein [Blastopirellula sp.]HAY82216.1 hypothetical protein [Planctomycetaceae bacterium]
MWQRLFPLVNQIRFTWWAAALAVVAIGLLLAHPVATVWLLLALVMGWLGIMYTRLLLVKRQEGWQSRFVVGVLVVMGAAVVTIISAWVLVVAMLGWFLPDVEGN